MTDSPVHKRRKTVELLPVHPLASNQTQEYQREVEEDAVVPRTNEGHLLPTTRTVTNEDADNDRRQSDADRELDLQLRNEALSLLTPIIPLSPLTRQMPDTSPSLPSSPVLVPETLTVTHASKTGPSVKPLLKRKSKDIGLLTSLSYPLPGLSLDETATIPSLSEMKSHHFSIFSIWSVLKEEIMSSDIEESDDLKTARVRNFLKVPMELERVTTYFHGCAQIPDNIHKCHLQSFCLWVL